LHARISYAIACEKGWITYGTLGEDVLDYGTPLRNDTVYVQQYVDDISASLGIEPNSVIEPSLGTPKLLEFNTMVTEDETNSSQQNENDES
jgi:hypothetical protein